MKKISESPNTGRLCGRWLIHLVLSVKMVVLYSTDGDSLREVIQWQSMRPHSIWVRWMYWNSSILLVTICIIIDFLQKRVRYQRAQESELTSYLHILYIAYWIQYSYSTYIYIYITYNNGIDHFPEAGCLPLLRNH